MSKSLSGGSAQHETTDDVQAADDECGGKKLALDLHEHVDHACTAEAAAFSHMHKGPLKYPLLLWDELAPAHAVHGAEKKPGCYREPWTMQHGWM